MKVLLAAAIAATLTTTVCLSQNSSSIYYSLWGRYDLHADYRPETNFNTPIGPPTKLSGIGIGMNIGYRKMLGNYLFVEGDVGINRMYVDKIEMDLPAPYNIPPFSNHRYMLVPGGGTLGAQCYKYWYNNLQVQAGLGYGFPISEMNLLTTTVTYYNNFTFSQRYLYAGVNPPKFLNKEFRYLGSGSNLKLGFLKANEKGYFQPELVIGIWHRLTGDPVFEEVKSMRTDQWFGGVGIMLRKGFYIGR